MARCIKKYNCPDNGELIMWEIDAYLIARGYEYENYDGEIVYRKGNGWFTDPKYFKIQRSDEYIAIEGWLKWPYAEIDYSVNAYFGFVPRKQMQSDAAGIERIISRHSYAVSQNYGGDKWADVVPQEKPNEEENISNYDYANIFENGGGAIEQTIGFDVEKNISNDTEMNIKEQTDEELNCGEDCINYGGDSQSDESLSSLFEISEDFKEGVKKVIQHIKALPEKIKQIFSNIKEFFGNKKVQIASAVIGGIIFLLTISAYAFYADWFGRIGLNIAIHQNNNGKVTNYIETRIERKNLHKSVLKAIDYLVDTDNIENHNYVVDKFLYYPNETAEKYQNDAFGLFAEKNLFEFVKNAKNSDFLYEQKWLTGIYNSNGDAFVKYISDSMNADLENAKVGLENYYKTRHPQNGVREVILQMFIENGTNMSDIDFLVQQYFEETENIYLTQMLKRIDENAVRKSAFAYIGNNLKDDSNLNLLKTRLNKYREDLLGSQDGVENLISQTEQAIGYEKEAQAVQTAISEKETKKNQTEKNISSADKEINDLQADINETQRSINVLELDKPSWFTLTAYIVGDQGYSGGYHVYEIALLNGYGYPTSTHAALYTKERTYSSKGRFSLSVKSGDSINVTLKEEYGSFTQKWNTYYEVTSSDYQKLSEINTKISNHRDDIEEYNNDIEKKKSEKTKLNNELSSIKSEISKLEQTKKKHENLKNSVINKILVVLLEG